MALKIQAIVPYLTMSRGRSFLLLIGPDRAAAAARGRLLPARQLHHKHAGEPVDDVEVSARDRQAGRRPE